MELEPPLIVAEPMPFGERVSRDGLFEGRLDPLYDFLTGSDPGLAGLSGRVADADAGDLDAAYERSVGVAIERHDAELRAGSQSAAGPLLANGGNVDTLHSAVVRYLPSPDAPFDTTFIDPPDGGVVHTGRGFDSASGGTSPPGRDEGPPAGGDKSHPAIVREQVRNLYLTLLNREPDQGGWDTWVDAILNGGWTLADVRQAFLDSDEYHDKHPG